MTESSTAEFVDLAVQIVRFVDDHNPGFVESEFVDADGRRHVLMDKAPIFTNEDLDRESQYPQADAVQCRAVRFWRDASGRELVAVKTIESVEGLSGFVVLREQVSPLER